MSTPPRTKLHSLVGMEVLLLSLDGQLINQMKVVIDEVSEYGLLFRHPNGTLVFASSAAFTVGLQSSEPKE